MERRIMGRREDKNDADELTGFDKADLKTWV